MSKDGSDDNETLELPNDTLAALQEFYAHRSSQEKRFEDLKMDINSQEPRVPLSMDLFSEDWNASQFWYSDKTATMLAQQLLKNASASTNICIVSAPSVFVQLKNLIASKTREIPGISLLEFDNRFDVFKEFVHYDFKHPLSLPSSMKGKYDRILCDPPFLSPDCQTKVAMTVRWLSKDASTESEQPTTRIIICTGERMEGLITKLYPGTRTTSFDPQHAQNRLSNDFRSFANFECSEWTWRR